MSPNGKAEDIQAAAAAWFERREWSNWDAAAEKELEAWLSASTAHRIAFIRLEAAWERAERLRALGAGVPPGEVPGRGTFGFGPENSASPPEESGSITLGDLPHRTWPARLKWAGVGITSLAAVLAAAVWYQSASRWQAYGTQVGTIAPVALADGSRITLDSNTRIQVALDNRQRLIQLDRGEALFDVAKDPTRPLIVEMAG
jgi:transmembrane sensor